jgi:hypothetical protein
MLDASLTVKGIISWAAKLKIIAAANSALQPSRAAKDNFVALITPLEESTLYHVMGPNQLIDKIVKKKGVTCL